MMINIDPAASAPSLNAETSQEQTPRLASSFQNLLMATGGSPTTVTITATHDSGAAFQNLAGFEMPVVITAVNGGSLPSGAFTGAVMITAVSGNRYPPPNPEGQPEIQTITAVHTNSGSTEPYQTTAPDAFTGAIVITAVSSNRYPAQSPESQSGIQTITALHTSPGPMDPYQTAMSDARSLHREAHRDHLKGDDADAARLNGDAALAAEKAAGYAGRSGNSDEEATAFQTGAKYSGFAADRASDEAKKSPDNAAFSSAFDDMSAHYREESFGDDMKSAEAEIPQNFSLQPQASDDAAQAALYAQAMRGFLANE